MDIQSEVQYFDYLELTYNQKSGHMLLAVDSEKNIQHIVYTGESSLPTPAGSYGSQGGTIFLRLPNLFPLTLRKTFKTQKEYDNEFDKICILIKQVDDAENSVHSPSSKYNRNKSAVTPLI
ncbi:hypothetical protein [Rheinheimera sp.]|uniref:hypothetical protein n=1 Tax=Rheinheimera sp. TaxID=1869214 RepID=UPI002732EBE3|nr:hypothetical protein [Rheinheimera sp.]MDP2716222.1 hypothetical protein [Rheinheimera sp.]